MEEEEWIKMKGEKRGVVWKMGVVEMGKGIMGK